MPRILRVPSILALSRTFGADLRNVGNVYSNLVGTHGTENSFTQYDRKRLQNKSICSSGGLDRDFVVPLGSLNHINTIKRPPSGPPLTTSANTQNRSVIHIFASMTPLFDANGQPVKLSFFDLFLHSTTSRSGKGTPGIERKKVSKTLILHPTLPLYPSSF